MSQQVTPPGPPEERRPQNWLGIGCYVVVGIVAVLVLVGLIAICSPHGGT